MAKITYHVSSKHGLVEFNVRKIYLAFTKYLKENNISYVTYVYQKN